MLIWGGVRAYKKKSNTAKDKYTLSFYLQTMLIMEKSK